jgi:hypothetical protein
MGSWGSYKKLMGQYVNIPGGILHTNFLWRKNNALLVGCYANKYGLLLVAHQSAGRPRWSSWLLERGFTVTHLGLLDSKLKSSWGTSSSPSGSVCGTAQVGY